MDTDRLCYSVLLAVNKQMPNKSIVRSKGVRFSARFSIQFEADGHNTSKVRKQRKRNAGAHFLRLIQSRIPALGMELTTVEVSLPTSVS